MNTLFPHLPFDPQAVFLDFNGVLVDDEELHFLLLAEVMAQEGLKLTEEDYHERYIAFDDEGCFRLAFQELGRPMTEPVLADLIERKAALYDARAAEEAPFFPGAENLLSALRESGLPTAIVSGALRREILLHLRRAGHDGWPGVIVAAEDTEEGKPSPMPYRAAVAALSRQASPLPPEACLAVEDTVGGVTAANGAGLWTVGLLTTGATTTQLLQAGARKVLDNLPLLMA